MIPWLRKNSFIKNLRQALSYFRIVETSVDIADEARFAEGGVIERTGRQIITIKLTGYWRGKASTKIEGEKVD